MDNNNRDQDHDWIRQRAYEFWEIEGRPAGKHEEHWQRAAEQREAEQGRGEPPVRGEVPGLEPFETLTNQDSTD